jgi:hypothetical protein
LAANGKLQDNAISSFCIVLAQQLYILFELLT